MVAGPGTCSHAVGYEVTDALRWSAIRQAHACLVKCDKHQVTFQIKYHNDPADCFFVLSDGIVLHQRVYYIPAYKVCMWLLRYQAPQRQGDCVLLSGTAVPHEAFAMAEERACALQGRHGVAGINRMPHIFNEIKSNPWFHRHCNNGFC